MTPGHSRTPYIAAIFVLSVLASFVVLNRWLVTDIGLLSFGRVWQLYISYEDFGFVRRGLVGTLFSVTGLNTLVLNEYHFALVAQHVAIVILAGLLFFYIYSRRIDNVLFVATIALSPALIIHSGYTTGSLDIFVLILVAVNILYCRRLIPFCAVLITGIFAHELFVFTIPAQFLAYYFFLRGQGRDGLLIHVAATVMSVLFAVFIVLVYGAIDVSEAAYERVMEAKIPLATGQHALWSGFYELSSSTEQYASESVQRFLREISLGTLFLVIPLLYVVLVLARLLSCATNGLDKLMLAGATLLPLSTAFFATDLYRWIGMSAGVSLLLTLVMVDKSVAPRSGFNYVLLLFSLLAPFGAGQIDRPFPLHQFLLEQLFFSSV